MKECLFGSWVADKAFSVMSEPVRIGFELRGPSRLRTIIALSGKCVGRLRNGFACSGGFLNRHWRSGAFQTAERVHLSPHIETTFLAIHLSNTLAYRVRSGSFISASEAVKYCRGRCQDSPGALVCNELAINGNRDKIKRLFILQTDVFVFIDKIFILRVSDVFDREESWMRFINGQYNTSQNHKDSLIKTM